MKYEQSYHVIISPVFNFKGRKKLVLIIGRMFKKKSTALEIPVLP